MILLHVGDHLFRATSFGDFFGQWQLEIAPLVVIVAITAVYLWGLRRLKARTKFEAVSSGQTTLFLLGIAFLLLALVSPIDTYGGDLFFIHMIQHILLVMVAAPLILLSNSMGVFMWSLPRGLRYDLGELLSGGGVLRRTLSFMASPRTAFLTYFGVLTIWHIPVAYDTALAITPLHYLEHLTMFLAALLFWWPVIGSAPIRSRLSYPVRILYLLLATIVSTVLGIAVTFGGGDLYSFYVDAPQHWGITLQQDMQLGGLIMWIPGNMMFLISIAALFLVWADRDEKDSARWRLAQEKRSTYAERTRGV